MDLQGLSQAQQGSSALAGLAAVSAAVIDGANSEVENCNDGQKGQEGESKPLLAWSKKPTVLRSGFDVLRLRHRVVLSTLRVHTDRATRPEKSALPCYQGCSDR